MSVRAHRARTGGPVKAPGEPVPRPNCLGSPATRPPAECHRPRAESTLARGIPSTMESPAKPVLAVKWKRTLASIVVVARDVNQSIFKPSWLLREGILLAGETDGPETVFAAGLTKVTTDSFELLVLPDRIQMGLPPDASGGDALVSRVLGGVARTLPHTPFVAVGLNNSFEVSPTDAVGFFEWNRRKFGSQWALTQTDENPRNRYGCSFAFDAFDGARMRVRAAVGASPDEAGTETETDGSVKPYVVKLHCNLHRDLPPADGIRELIRILSLWDQVRARTESIAKGLAE